MSMVVTWGSTSRATVGSTGSSSSTRAVSGPLPLIEPLVKKFTVDTGTAGKGGGGGKKGWESRQQRFSTAISLL